MTPKERAKFVLSVYRIVLDAFAATVHDTLSKRIEEMSDDEAEALTEHLQEAWKLARKPPIPTGRTPNEPNEQRVSDTTVHFKPEFRRFENVDADPTVDELIAELDAFACERPQRARVFVVRNGLRIESNGKRIGFVRLPRMKR